VTAVRGSPELDAPRRPTDLLEDVVARLLGAVAIFGCGVALLVGLTEFTATLQRSRVEAALSSGLASGLAVLMLDAALVSGAWWATRRATSAINAAAWEREWALVEPQWRDLPR